MKWKKREEKRTPEEEDDDERKKFDALPFSLLFGEFTNIARNERVRRNEWRVNE